ncbi:SsrA-binding protein SmpB [uncultured Propionibacterium sp.]|uniref:SsrA-binding protein SmpB n=1 Tax=uncultured Propionibacterium sp. TaxID=218066 RepID=UPI0029316CE4|nr:SsrA-binding protein SmpB [uncultured Propionibacterium sp.]
MPRERGERMIARNRRALHDYSIGERLEAGIVLTGTEVKSLRDGRASLSDAFATVDDGEVWLRQANIPEYSMGSWRRGHTALRKRKLLLHRKEIARLERQLAGSGRTLVPLSMYFKDGRAKVEIAVGTGKREWDKRQSIRERDMNREAQRELADRNKRNG